MKYTRLRNIGIISQGLLWLWILITRMKGILSSTIILNVVVMEFWIWIILGTKKQEDIMPILC